ncbi:hypothetical protein [Brevundimonas sp.]|jgi:hypothetical protein|uniref:hypothetical protein n=1 Tax=Brevundimonas sp. TaxID=1871086 RepID=UPI0037C0D7B4
MSKLLKITAVAAAPVIAMTLMAAPASAQSRDRDDTARNALIGAAVGGLAGAVYSNGDGRYVAGGALAGAAVGAAASSNRGSDCGYRRGGQCYRNQGHWEREHGINSRDPRWEQRRDYRDYRREQRYDRRDDRRDYRYDRRW